MKYTHRQAAAARVLSKADAFLVTDRSNVRYLCGFTGSSGILLITASRKLFITDFRYKDQSSREVVGCELEIAKKSLIKSAISACKAAGLKSLAFESSVPYSTYSELAATGLTMLPTTDHIAIIRSVKEEAEVALIREAARRAESAFLDMKKSIRAGATESSLATKLAERLRRHGCSRLPFDIILASGENSAMPHAGVTNRKLRPGDLVTIDWGGECDGYFSDMTRTFLLKGGADSAKKREIYDLVLRANRASIRKVKPGAASREVDATARGLITRDGYGEQFGHGLGHGVGLDVHELPRLTWARNTALKRGMVFTVEPGVYVPGIGGVRIEDMALVSAKGADVITTLPVELEII